MDLYIAVYVTYLSVINVGYIYIYRSRPRALKAWTCITCRYRSVSEGASQPSQSARRCRCRLMWHKMAIKGEVQRAEAIKLITDVTDWNPLCGFCVAEGGVHDLISSIHFIPFFPAEQLMQREFGTVIVCCSLSCWNWACSLYLLLGVSDIKKWRRGSLWRSAGFVCLIWFIGFWINGENSELFYSRTEILGNSLFLQSVLAKLHWQHI